MLETVSIEQDCFDFVIDRRKFCGVCGRLPRKTRKAGLKTYKEVIFFLLKYHYSLNCAYLRRVSVNSMSQYFHCIALQCKNDTFYKH